MSEDEKPVVADRQWPVSLKLKRPVEFGSELVASLVFRDGKMGDLPKGMKVGEMPSYQQIIAIASKMCGQPTNVLDLLGPEDGAEVQDIALGFFVRSLPGGTKK